MSYWGETLTDFIHGDNKSFQFGAFGQEVGRHALHVVLAQIERLDLRQTQRHMQLIYTVTVGEAQMSFFLKSVSLQTDRNDDIQGALGTNSNNSVS